MRYNSGVVNLKNVNLDAGAGHRYGNGRLARWLPLKDNRAQFIWDAAS